MSSITCSRRAKNQRLRIKCEVDDATPVPSVVELYPVANWYEREAYDMCGILFSGTPGPASPPDRPTVSGFPAAQGFPLAGYVEVRYDGCTKARRLRAGPADPGVPLVRLPEPLGGDPSTYSPVTKRQKQ